MWQLKKLSTNEILEGPKKLPENWGPIFGLHGFQEKLGDLAWLGEDYADTGWEEVEGTAPEDIQSSPADLAWEQAKALLRDSDWTMLSDVPMTVGEKADWTTYRAALRDIRSQESFPEKIVWPTKPE